MTHLTTQKQISKFVYLNQQLSLCFVSNKKQALINNNIVKCPLHVTIISTFSVHWLPPENQLHCKKVHVGAFHLLTVARTSEDW